MYVFKIEGAPHTSASLFSGKEDKHLLNQIFKSHDVGGFARILTHSFFVFGTESIQIPTSVDCSMKSMATFVKFHASLGALFASATFDGVSLRRPVRFVPRELGAGRR